VLASVRCACGSVARLGFLIVFHRANTVSLIIRVSVGTHAGQFFQPATVFEDIASLRTIPAVDE
jgi:hypothetical protein